MKTKVLAAAVAALSLTLMGCFERPMDLTIAHINDHHSHLEADDGLDITVGGESTRVEVGGFPRVVTKIREIDEAKQNVLKLHAGDAITGDLYYTLFGGEADAAMMNQVCFDAFALGNHEFDDGDAGLKTFLDQLATADCNTRVVAANVRPEVGVSPLTPQGKWDSFRPFVVKKFNGQKVGIIGIDIATKTKNSSNPDATTEFLDETKTAQKFINKLKKKGVNKIVLLTHYQYGNDLELAKNLSGVDVIIGGDSHSLLGDFDAVGLNSAGDYPTMVTNKDGDPVCVAQAWQYSSIVGELDISFDRKGVVEQCSGTPHLMLGDTFKRRNAEGTRVELEGADRDAVYADIDANPVLSIVERDAETQTLLDTYTQRIEEETQTVIANATSNLCLERVPGQGISSLCDVSETQSNGSDVSNLVAKAFMLQSLEADVAIQNAGGVRADVPMGDVTIATAYQLLPFGNTLVNLNMSGAEIKLALEQGVDYVLNPDGSSGAYPYASGLRFDVDISKTFGERVTNIEINSRLAGDWVALDTASTEANIQVVTNSFVSGGRDGYFVFGDVTNDGRAVDTYLDYAKAFVDYAEAVGTLSKLPLEEYSTQRFYDADGNLQ
ncbi:NAD 5'-nucleotidase precursor [Grimontia celer]|uniref:NAD 5'-nucleotidase n=1 Tax=Grimontia celer TaxID=1796497 RepID=A0A128F348_9GAMM|nr:NAD nucleotidase [Grimontia celer]CZF81228.1 NAD 5'-nucleotidase precursor [Grimontia celer]